ncbi:MAG: HslU--HslV peptidase ATPase subunit, partial [Buchnera aphidicola]|nr:HslU--HslV peptidase ATPase subunit [Buchnera aphidicola]MDE5285769.1 HslU--HslV peptidase ATPase subunit [Buchnera aphidicola]
NDFEKILTEPTASITAQYIALMETEGVYINFTQEGIRNIAEVAWQVNESMENIGARRLHTILEKLMEDLSFNADNHKGQTIKIDSKYVEKHLDKLTLKEDLSRFIL